MIFGMPSVRFVELANDCQRIIKREIDFGDVSLAIPRTQKHLHHESLGIIVKPGLLGLQWMDKTPLLAGATG